MRRFKRCQILGLLHKKLIIQENSFNIIVVLLQEIRDISDEYSDFSYVRICFQWASAIMSSSTALYMHKERYKYFTKSSLNAKLKM